MTLRPRRRHGHAPGQSWPGPVMLASIRDTLRGIGQQGGAQSPKRRRPAATRPKPPLPTCLGVRTPGFPSRQNVLRHSSDRRHLVPSSAWPVMAVTLGAAVDVAVLRQ
ncbi:hypothetical protein ACFFX0_30725 [Citricoccus parietis]|uniref:Uncharacterized protein n=1 Tax=Citricoccus parietis TaxID=592307 RepID=A0ABV5G8P3_9MICC